MMPEGDTRRGTDESRSRTLRILAAREQVEAAQVRELRIARRVKAPENWLPSLPRYTVVRELHRGGQGVVYLAVQESTGRRVAVKILGRGPLAGSDEAMARFEREVESLSLLRHPNVVTIHDCGREHEHVFLVMDFIDGRPLDVYAGAARLPVRDILGLFAKVCDGVHAAHLRGVIHRDLKPGNILVDNRGEPHILDFGLAKLTGSSAAESTVMAMTRAGQFVGSLPWASPEQAQGRTDELDIRTDVYSLGVVLYQLLVGQFPYQVSGNALDVVRRIVHTPPAAPSAVSGRAVDGELETILLKCLAKEPERRYQSAGDLARDLRRYQSGEPIEARRDSLPYVLGKRLARYRLALFAGAAMLMVVTALLAVSIEQWRRAGHNAGDARRSAAAAEASAVRADREADQARAVVGFLGEVLGSVEPERRGADVRLIEVLASASKTVSERLGAHPEQEAEVRGLLGRSYLRLSMWPDARAQFARAMDLWKESAGADDARTLAAQHLLARTLLNAAETESAEALLGDLLPRLERALGPDDPLSLDALRSMAHVHLQRGRVQQAEDILRALRVHPRLVGDDGSQILLLQALMAVHTHRMSSEDTEQNLRNLAAAEALALECMERAHRSLGPDAAQTLLVTAKWAEIAGGLGRFDEAAEACRRVLAVSADRLGECHTVRSSAMTTLAHAMARLGDEQEPAELFLRAIECARRMYGPENPVFLGTVSESLRYLERAERAREGEELARELSGSLRRFGGGHDDLALTPDLFIAGFVSMQGRLEEAGVLFGPLLEAAEGQADARTRARVHIMYGRHLVRCARYKEAERELLLAAERVGDVLIGTWDSHPDDLILAFISLYEAWGKPDKAADYRTLRRSARGY